MVEILVTDMKEKHNAQAFRRYNLVMDHVADGAPAVPRVSRVQGAHHGATGGKQGSRQDGSYRSGSESGHDGSVEAVGKVMVRELAPIVRAEVEREMQRHG